jgi:lysozyme
MLTFSPNGVKVAHSFEKCKLQAYPDPGSKDGHPWTIGWGHTGPEVVPGLVWTQAQADAAFLRDVQSAVKAVEQYVKVDLTQGQADALIDFVYNVGAGNFKSSTLLRMLNEGNTRAAREEFRRWNKNDGKVMLGLTRRRVAEIELWDGESADVAIEVANKIS